MRFALSSEDLEFFRKNLSIEFEGIFPKDQLALAEKEALQLNTKTVGEGRDVWRHASSIKKISLSPRLGEIASLLFDSKIVRLGYDQILTSSTALPEAWKKGASLAQISSVRPLLGGALLRLTSEEESNILFFSSHFIFPWKTISENPEQIFLLIAFLAEQGQYHLLDLDPATHALKKLGYAFGDALDFETHPILYRKRFR